MPARKVVELFRRAGLIEDIYGGGRTPYLRRWSLTPRTRLGKLVLHVFYRGDEDPDPHDHPWDFWTFPLSRSGYIELTPDEDGELKAVHVPGWRLTRREAEYAHLIAGRCFARHGEHFVAKGKFMTLVWMGPKRRDWGFWPKWTRAILLGLTTTGVMRGGRVQVHWGAYLHANRERAINCTNT